MVGHFLFFVAKRGKVVTFFDILFKVQTLSQIKKIKTLVMQHRGERVFSPTYCRSRRTHGCILYDVGFPSELIQCPRSNYIDVYYYNGSK
jgi:hypothetical protein